MSESLMHNGLVRCVRALLDRPRHLFELPFASEVPFLRAE